jgi:TIR domain
MEKGNYKFDVALSFAEEDRDIAVAIARELGHKGIQVYYYPDNIAETAGEDLPRILTEIYTKYAKYAVAILSDSYFKKKYAAIEFEAIKSRAAESLDTVYMIPLLAGDIALLGQHEMEEVGALKWEHNPEKIAEVLCTLLGVTKQNFWRDDKFSEYRNLLSNNDMIIKHIGNAVIVYQSKNKFLYWIIGTVITIFAFLLLWDKYFRLDSDIIPPIGPPIDTVITSSLPPHIVNFYQLRVSRDTITDIRLEQNDTISISAGGTISPAFLGDNCGPEGIPDGEKIVDKFLKGLICPFTQWNYAALVYRFDTSYGWKLCGSTESFDIAKKTGLLEFKINDTNQDDNSGGYDVNVTVWRLYK